MESKDHETIHTAPRHTCRATKSGAPALGARVFDPQQSTNAEMPADDSNDYLKEISTL